MILQRWRWSPTRLLSSLCIPRFQRIPVQELIALSKRQPGSLNYGSAGNGSTPHLHAELFKIMTGADLVHIPYKGSPEAIRDAAAGRVAFYMAPINTAIGLIKDEMQANHILLRGYAKPPDLEPINDRTPS
jgi:hypothetical protein